MSFIRHPLTFTRPGTAWLDCLGYHCFECDSSTAVGPTTSAGNAHERPSRASSRYDLRGRLTTGDRPLQRPSIVVIEEAGAGGGAVRLKRNGD